MNDDENGHGRERRGGPSPWWRVVSVNSIAQTMTLVAMLVTLIWFAAGVDSDTKIARAEASEARAAAVDMKAEVQRLAENQVRILQIIESVQANADRTATTLDRVSERLESTRDISLRLDGRGNP